MIIWLKLNIIVTVLLIVLIFIVKTVIASLKTEKERLDFKLEYNGFITFLVKVVMIVCVSYISLLICFIWNL